MTAAGKRDGNGKGEKPLADYLLSHDMGTSGHKATVYDLNGRMIGSCLCEYPTYYPARSYVEQEPDDWWQAVCRATRNLLEQTKIKPEDIAAVSFSGHMMGCLLVDDQGNPLGRSIIWADMRAKEQEEFLKSRIPMEEFYRITGHRISSSYGLAKLMWIRDHEPERYRKACRMLNAKDYIVYRLTGRLVTDYSDASGTNLLDITAKKWSEDIAKAAGIDMNLLPELLASTDVAGTVTPEAARETGLKEGTPVVIGGGDGSCAAAGAGVVQEGEIYNVIGSSSWISGASAQPHFDPEMRTFNWVHVDKNLYTPCGTMQSAGFSYQWLRNTLCQEEMKQAKLEGRSAYDLINEKAAQAPPGSGGVLFLPYLMGERSPRWNSDATAVFLGLKATTGRNELYRSVLEGVGYNLKIILDIISARFDKSSSVIVIGGGAKGELWLQILADIWQREIVVPRYLEEATSMGAALCAGVGIGAFRDFSVARTFNPPEKVIKPNPANRNVYEKLFRAFNAAYETLVPVYCEMAAL